MLHSSGAEYVGTRVANREDLRKDDVARPVAAMHSVGRRPTDPGGPNVFPAHESSAGVTKSSVSHAQNLDVR